MSRWIALLRGINVSGQKKIPMAELRSLCRELGWTQPRTYIQSGNLVFDAEGRQRGLEWALSAALAEHFGFDVTVLVRSAAELERLAAANPLVGPAESDPSKLFLLLPAEPVPAGLLASLETRGPAGEELVPGAGALYLYYPGGLGRSKWPNAYFERKLGVATTMRNWRTVSRLLALVQD